MDKDKYSLLFYSDFVEAYTVCYLVEALRLIWVGWEVNWAALEVADFAQIIGVDLPLVLENVEGELAAMRETDYSSSSVPREQAIDNLIETLTRDNSFSPATLYKKLTENGEDVTVGEGFWNDDLPTLTTEHRRDILRQLFEQIP